MLASSVICTTTDLQNNKQIGHAQLNLPGSLNALNLDMVQQLTEQLLCWQQDDNIAAVMLSGAGNKAFCAGGDVVSLYNAMVDSPGKISPSVQQFFTQEYELDYLIHTFSKPIIVWGNGFIMGGGIGLFAGAKHRVVTETSRLAMPEVSIGLFPDVGGSYFLNQLENNIGLFLGLTGVQFNGADAKFIGLADHAIAGIEVADFLVSLSNATLSDDIDHDLLAIFDDLEKSTCEHMPASNIARHQHLISEALSHNALENIIAEIAAWQSSEDKWLSRAAKTLNQGSPITQRLVFEQLRRGKGQSLADCFRMELTMACRASAAGEFQEGVRALLIEKDGRPAWLYENQAMIPDTFIESFFSHQWDGVSHPLAKLGA